MSKPERISAWILLALVAACGPPAHDGGGSEGAGTGDPELDGELLVSAAASLTDAFADLASTFERLHPDVEVTLNLAGSSTLRTQILEGAPVDVFASANRANMQRVSDAGAVASTPRTFARNRLVLAVPAGNPGGVSGLADLARDELLVGLCAEAVPCGDLARQALDQAGVTARPDTEEPDVRALLTKIMLGELDAGLTYGTDVASSDGETVGIALPPSVDVVAEYLIAELRDAPHPLAARAFVVFVLSSEGRAALGRYGFSPP